ncbi:hypothetical protein HPB50_029044 [Hyalomma asiaticum]|nr:hypothetical protein HPB50_029044 [Hyalomma asiaticum]
MSEQTMQMAQGGALGVDSLMWLDMVPMFTGDATGIDIEVFFKILEEAGRLGGLRDPVRRFVLSHEPRTFEEAVEVAVREEHIERSTQLHLESAHYASEKRELENRLDRLEGLIERSLGLSQHEREIEGQRRSMQPPLRCYDCGELGHSARECDRLLIDPLNESPEYESADRQNVDNRDVGEQGEEEVLVTVVNICGEYTALEPVGEEVEVSEMQWHVEEMLANEYGGESGDEASLSCGTPQVATPTEEGREEDESDEGPCETESKSVAEIVPGEKELVSGIPGVVREENPLVPWEPGGSLLLEKETGVVKCAQETCTITRNERRRRCSVGKSVTRRRRKANVGRSNAKASVKTRRAHFPQRCKLVLRRVDGRRPRCRMKRSNCEPQTACTSRGLWRVRKTPGPRPHRARIKEVSDWQDSHGMFRMSPAAAA